MLLFFSMNLLHQAKQGIIFQYRAIRPFGHPCTWQKCMHYPNEWNVCSEWCDVSFLCFWASGLWVGRLVTTQTLQSQSFLRFVWMNAMRCDMMSATEHKASSSSSSSSSSKRNNICWQQKHDLQLNGMEKCRQAERKGTKHSHPLNMKLLRKQIWNECRAVAGAARNEKLVLLYGCYRNPLLGTRYCMDFVTF